MDRIYAVQYKRMLSGKSKDEFAEGAVLGFTLSVAERDVKEPCRLKTRTIVFDCACQIVCKRWVKRIKRLIEVSERRPKYAKVFIQPYAGAGKAKEIYEQVVFPILQQAEIEVNITEDRLSLNPNYKKRTKEEDVFLEEIKDLDIAAFDCVICVGGDGTALTVLNGLLQRKQDEHEIVVSSGFTPKKINIPVSIIPAGKVNSIVHTVQGVIDPVTATLHTVLGNRLRVDMCSLWSDENFIKFNFNSSYGFTGKVHSFLHRYKWCGKKKLQAAFIKALTYSKFRSYCCEVSYIPIKEETAHRKVPCRTGCEQCADVYPESPTGSINYDNLVELEDQPLNVSNTSSTITDMSKASPWKTIKGSYINISVFTTPALCEMAPLGLSKHSHLADGYLDLVIVKAVERRHFIRHLKRHGNTKNQFDLWFVETYRVKDVKFRTRVNDSWDRKTTEGSDEELSDDDTPVLKSRPKTAAVSNARSQMEPIEESSSDDEAGKESEDLQNDQLNQRRTSNLHEVEAFTSQESLMMARRTRSKSAPTISVHKRLLKDSQDKKISCWCLDGDAGTEPNLQFRMHPKLVVLTGLGIHPDYKPKEAALSWLPSV